MSALLKQVLEDKTQDIELPSPACLLPPPSLYYWYRLPLQVLEAKAQDMEPPDLDDFEDYTLPVYDEEDAEVAAVAQQFKVGDGLAGCLYQMAAKGGVGPALGG